MGYKSKLEEVRVRTQTELDLAEIKLDEQLMAFRKSASEYEAFDIINRMPGTIHDLERCMFRVAALKEQLRMIEELEKTPWQFNLREYHPLSEMERIPAEGIEGIIDELFERMDKENVGFVITQEGKDSCVLCPYRWFEPVYETITIEVDAILLEQVKELIRPMGITVEQLIVRFLEWLVDPDTQEEAIAWLLKAKEEYEHDLERNLCEGHPNDEGAGGNQPPV